jgi:hypothetical protein
VDDYALIREFRNDLGALWRVGVRECKGEREGKLEVERLEVFPTRVEKLGGMLLDCEDGDWEWVGERIRVLSAEFGTEVRVTKDDTVVDVC